MRHLHAGRKLGVGPDRRKALLRSLTLALVEQEAITTTPAKAKETRWFAERIVTLAKRGDISGRRHIIKILGSTQTQHTGENRIRNVVDKIYTVLVPRFKDRPGGYTQIFKMAKRRAGDNAELCLMRYIPAEEDKKGGGKGKPAAKKSAKATPKAEAKAKAPRQDKAAKAAPEDKAGDKIEKKPAKKKAAAPEDK